MGIVSALVFAGALALIVAVIAGTLLPSWDRIIAALANEPTPQPRLVLARHHRVVRTDRRALHLAEQLREAA
jgi:hypothetical protein